MTTGIGSFSAQKAVGQHHSQLTRSMGTCVTSVMSVGADDQCAPVQTQPLTESAREAAIARAGAAMEAARNAFWRALAAEGMAAALPHLDRAHRHMGQMLTLAKINTRSKA